MNVARNRKSIWVLCRQIKIILWSEVKINKNLMSFLTYYWHSSSVAWKRSDLSTIHQSNATQVRKRLSVNKTQSFILRSYEVELRESWECLRRFWGRNLKKERALCAIWTDVHCNFLISCRSQKSPLLTSESKINYNIIKCNIAYLYIKSISRPEITREAVSVAAGQKMVQAESVIC